MGAFVRRDTGILKAKEILAGNLYFVGLLKKVKGDVEFLIL